MSKKRKRAADSTLRVSHPRGDKRSAFRLTPAELGAGPNQVWTAALFRNRLYVAWMTFNPDTGSFFRRIMYYEPTPNRWVTCYRHASRKGGDAPSQKSPSHNRHASSGIIDGRLLFHLKTPRTTVVLQSVDGEKFSKLSEDAALQPPPNPAWEEALAGRPDGAGDIPRRVTTYGERMLAAVDDTRLGVSVYAIESGPHQQSTKWRLLLERGAARYSQNGHLLAAVPWQDRLYMVLGSEAEALPRKPYSGFELLSMPVDGDQSWHLLIGVPRVTSQGFKAPLSRLGPGMNEFEPHKFLFLQPAHNLLVLGTYSELSGLTCWFSRDGMQWDQHADLHLAGAHPVTSVQAFTISDGIYLLVNSLDPARGPCADIWHVTG